MSPKRKGPQTDGQPTPDSPSSRAPDLSETMTPTFLLLHGAWHGAWCWDEVRRQLEGEGARVLTPTLRGLAERAGELEASIGLHSHLQEAQSLLQSLEPARVVLCAHSYAGMLARGLADRGRERLAAILYLDAYLPDPGQCGLDLRGVEANRKLLSSLRDGWRLPPPPASAFGLPAPLCEQADARLTAMPLACFQEPLSFEHQSLSNPPASYLRTTWINPGLDAAAARFEQAGRPIHHWPCGHDVMLEAPRELARLLLRIARSAG